MKISLVTSLCVLTALLASAQKKTSSKPNVLFIVADDMSMNAGVYGDHTITTPGIDGVAKDGVVFEHAYCTASSCSPSRASILTGMYPHQLKEGGNLWGTLPVAYPTYTRILADNGYQVGLTGKGWGPGDFTVGGYKENPAGPDFKDLAAFLDKADHAKPFCFWIGSHDPHRPYKTDLKNSVKFNLDALRVPAWLPDNATVREDLLDYYAAVKRFDQTVEEAVALLKKNGQYDNTLIIITSDNGMPFPRIKANAYDASTNIPLVMRFGKQFRSGRRTELISLVDMAPTILDALMVKRVNSMTGKSFLPLLVSGAKDVRFDVVFTERERHAFVRENSLGYPIRAVRTRQYLYIENLKPERWPAGDPASEQSTGSFGDIDPGPAKQFLVDNRDNPVYKQHAGWSLEKRQAVELYDLTKDPSQLKNLANDKQYTNVKLELGAKLSVWRRKTSDPLLLKTEDIFDTYPYYGGKGKKGNQ